MDYVREQVWVAGHSKGLYSLFPPEIEVHVLVHLRIFTLTLLLQDILLKLFSTFEHKFNPRHILPLWPDFHLKAAEGAIYEYAFSLQMVFLKRMPR